MNTAPVELSSLIEVRPEVVWLHPEDGDQAYAFYRAPDGTCKSQAISALDVRFLECLDGSRSKSDILAKLDISADHFDEIFARFVSFAPKSFGVRSGDPALALKRHKSISAAVELRDIWAAMSAGQDENEGFHKTGLDDAQTQFDSVETTLSHSYRVPTTALSNQSYGAAFCDWLLQHGWIKPHAKLMEVGCGIGYFAEAVLTALSQKRPDLYDTISYTMFDLSPELASAQRQTCAAHLGKIRAVHGNIETYDFGDEQFDLVISNEVIADLSVARFSVAEVHANTPSTEAARLALKYDLALPQSVKGAHASALLNLGAIRFVESLAQCLSPEGNAILTEYGTLDRSPRAVHFLNHLEFSVQFEHLNAIAQQIGFQTKLQTLGDMLNFDESYSPLDTASFHILSGAVLPFLQKPALPHLAYSHAMLEEAIGPDIHHVKNLVFRPLTDSRAFTPFRFFALALQKPAEAEPLA